MKLKQHIGIGNRLIESMDNETLEKFKFNRKAYLIGCIAPDINCIYPAHRLTTTEKRFLTHLKRIDKSDVGIIKSFRLGLVTHYICDYFCYAHNNESVGVWHKKYETGLFAYYNEHADELREEMESDDMIHTWQLNKAMSVAKTAPSGTMDNIAHCNLIMEQIKLMNADYKNKCPINKNSNWYTKRIQMRDDITYAMFMVQNITMLIMEPFKCMVCQY